MSLYDKLLDEKLFERCANSVIHSKPLYRRSTSRGSDGVTIEQFKNNLPNEIKSIISDLSASRYKFKKLRGIPIAKVGPTDRLITAPSIRDRVLQKGLLSVINPCLFSIVNTGCSYCGVKKNIDAKTKGSLNSQKAILKLYSHIKLGRYWVLKTDIEKFFDSVPKEKLLKKVCSYLPDNALDTLIRDLVYFQLDNVSQLESNPRIEMPKPEIGISQGSSLSPLFANVYLSDFDREVNSEFGDVMIRYVDDLLFVVDSEIIAQKIKCFIEPKLDKINLNLSADTEKTYTVNLSNKKLDFLGLRITRNKITEKNYTKISHYIFNEVFNLGSREYRGCSGVPEKLCLLESKLNGIVNYYAPYHTEKLIKNINKIIITKQQHKVFSSVSTIFVPDKKLISEENWRAVFKKSILLPASPASAAEAPSRGAA